MNPDALEEMARRHPELDLVFSKAAATRRWLPPELVDAPST
jgi:hypothetical protein